MATTDPTQSLSLRSQEAPDLLGRNDGSLAAYRRLALQLHHDLGHGPTSRSVLVVSPDDAGTCARVAANLACCMAEELGRGVLLADATREGMLSSALADAIPLGLNNLLSDTSLGLEKLVLPTSFADVSFLPSGTRSKGYSPENSDRLLQQAALRFDFAVVAAGAILSDPFALASAPCYGAVLLLVVENETPTKLFEEAGHSLKMCGVERLHVTLVERHEVV